MKKILVPVDFSVASSWGFYYAYDLAQAVGAELIVLHMYLPYSESTFSKEISNFLKHQEQAEATKRKSEIMAHLKAATQRPVTEKIDPVKITYVIDYGEKEGIVDYAKEHTADMIVMGTHGSGNGIDRIWGSNTSNVINKANCPVLAIPPGKVFKMKGNIAYATNFSPSDIKTISQLALIAAATNSSLHCVHVNLASGAAHEADEKEFEEKIKKDLNGFPVTFSTWSANSIEDGLNIFCRVNKIDILAMLPHDRTALNKFFGGKSMTRFMALQSELPLLAFHE